MADAGPIVLLTRPRPASNRVAEDLTDAVSVPYRILIAPILTITPVGETPALDDAGALILTSENAVDRLGKVPAGLTAYCVGDRTADAAGALGLTAISVGGDADALVARILADRPQGRLVHLRGATARGRVAERLAHAGLLAESVVVYRQDPCTLTEDVAGVLAQAHRIIAPLYSPASAAALAGAWPDNAPSPDVVAISQAAADGFQGPVNTCVIAATPDGSAMIAALAGAIGAVGPCP